MSGLFGGRQLWYMHQDVARFWNEDQTRQTWCGSLDGIQAVLPSCRPAPWSSLHSPVFWPAHPPQQDSLSGLLLGCSQSRCNRPQMQYLIRPQTAIILALLAAPQMMGRVLLNYGTIVPKSPLTAFLPWCWKSHHKDSLTRRSWCPAHLGQNT